MSVQEVTPTRDDHAQRLSNRLAAWCFLCFTIVLILTLFFLSLVYISYPLDAHEVRNLQPYASITVVASVLSVVGFVLAASAMRVKNQGDTIAMFVSALIGAMASSAYAVFVMVTVFKGF